MIRLRSILWSVCVSLLVMVPSQQAVMADDTEIFFGSSANVQNSAVKPNVLFIMDTSGSMVNNTDGTGVTRLDRMKKALKSIIATSNNINMGLMRFNNPGAAVLYPVTDIDLPVASADQGIITTRVSDGLDDGQQLSSGEVVLDSNTLSLVKVLGTTSSAQLAGLRFQDVGIPQGATITSASIVFTAASDAIGTTSLIFKAEDADSSVAFSETNNDISNRELTTASLDWNAVPMWDDGDSYETPDLASVVQEVVSRPGWCGGNALSVIVSSTSTSFSRFAKTYDNDAGEAPKLKIEYDVNSIPANAGCILKEYSAQIAASSDDVEENKLNGRIYAISSDLEIELDDEVNDHQVIGLRFGRLSLPRMSVVTEAYLEFTADGNSSGASTVTITGIATDDADTFSMDDYDVTSRASTSAAVSWGLSSWNDEGVYRTGNIASVVNEIVVRNGWSTASHIAFKVTATSGTHRAYSYNGNPGKAVRLVVRAKSFAGSDVKKVRDVLLEVVDDMVAGTGTPIVDALYEGALYYRGLDVLYGKQRGYQGLGDIRRNNRVSSEKSYTGGTHVYPEGCTESNLNSIDCVNEQITGSPTYISPIVGSCTESNSIVLLSDGAAHQNSSASKIRQMANISGCDDGGNEACGPELAKFLRESAGNIKTYTIGFNISDQQDATDFLKKIALNGTNPDADVADDVVGKGGFYSADSTEDLIKAFNEIVTNDMTTKSTFVVPGLAVNSFNRLNHRDEMYFSLFEPKSTPFWPGNLKRYQLVDGVIKDKNVIPAIDASTGFFKSSSKSWWSSGVDGDVVGEGGAVDVLDANRNSRRVYTYLGGESLDLLKEGNASLTKDLLGIASESDEYRTGLIQWIRGKDVGRIAAPLHSSPNVVIYGGDDEDPDATIFFGDNQGYLHAIDGETGEELFAFIPKDLLPMQKKLFENQEATTHPYGLDGQVTTWVNDLDGDGVIEPETGGTGDTVYLYIGMRRGGNQYYALDVTYRNAPKLMWSITGGTGDFSQLGQTWSQPKKSRVNIGGVSRDVIIFSGGYDPRQDDVTNREEDTVGRAIYMVDAKTGAKVWSAGPAGTGADEVFTDMKYSIPSSIVVLDINDDGLADKMFVGDMGGQLWRFDIANGKALNDLVTGGVIFEASGTVADTNEVHNRRFYHEPDISTFRRNRERFFAISIGSGFHAHPLNNVIEDRFYVVHDSGVMTNSAAPITYEKLTESDLYDATDNKLGENESSVSAASIDKLEAGGWYIRFNTRSGEKVLASSLTLQHQVYFTTYTPESVVNASSCTASAGTARLYHVNVKDATPVKNYDGVGGGNIESLTRSDRELVLQTTAIAPSPVRLRVNGKDVVVIGMEVAEVPEDNTVYTRTHWYEE